MTVALAPAPTSQPMPFGNAHAGRTEIVTFAAKGDFNALDDARAALIAAGFSVGVWSAGEPCGFLVGEFDIGKWRNLSAAERRFLHGTLTGDGRRGPLTASLRDDAPAAARIAFDRLIQSERTTL